MHGMCGAVGSLNKSFAGVSPLGDYSPLLTALLRLTSIKSIAKALTTLPEWVADVDVLDNAHPLTKGRDAAGTLLGCAYDVAIIPGRVTLDS